MHCQVPPTLLLRQWIEPLAKVTDSRLNLTFTVIGYWGLNKYDIICFLFLKRKNIQQIGKINKSSFKTSTLYESRFNFCVAEILKDINLLSLWNKCISA